MKFKEYPGYTKAYVLIHNTGFGVQEAPYEEHGVVYETNNLDDATWMASELKRKNNSAEAIESSWCDNTYHINVNTISEQGKMLFSAFEKEFEERFKKATESEEYKTFEIDGQIILIKKNPHFEENNLPPLQSKKIIWSDLKQNEG